MKKYILIFCLIQIGLMCSLKAQDYEPLVRENAHWVVADYVAGIILYDNFREYFTEGDTIVNSKLYKKVYKYILTPTNDNYQPPFDRTGPPQLFGMLREDTVNKIVFGILLNPFTYDCFITEDTLFDFSVSVNDSLDLCIASEFGNPITITSIQYYNVFGYNTKVFDGISAGGGATFYEGIGSTHGLFESLMIYIKEFKQHVLLCYTRDDISNCDVITQLSESTELPEIKLFPNPVTDGQITFEFQYTKHQRDMELRCFDVFGKEVHSEKVYQFQEEIKVDIQNWPKGIYFAIVYSGGLPIGDIKFVVQ